ncbi:MAG: 1,4-dihydroxy-6-naphthoate synthase [Desulfovibrio sp.]|jgi:1,4-dihydroxy-6-naphthoate synthase|nr:1,4-dihydroxy-6-naphthoate synthase [Desulfovibrio sp.]
MTTQISLGLSPCPNDTFIFHALLHGLVPALAAPIVPHFADVEELNALARQQQLDITKISLGVVPHIMRGYVLLNAGAALGWSCGPLVVAREDLPQQAWRTARMATPGTFTTANLLLDMHGGFQGPRIHLLFNEIMPAVSRGDVDMGIIIHEGRFTYERMGLKNILDMGEWWEGTFRIPLPLGVIAARRDLPVAGDMQTAIAASLAHARAHPEDSRNFIRAHAQEMDEDVTRAHIATFVTDFSLDLGPQGRAAIATLAGRAAALHGLQLPAEGLFLS